MVNVPMRVGVGAIVVGGLLLAFGGKRSRTHVVWPFRRSRTTSSI